MAIEGSVRLTGLFPTRKGGMWTGTMRREEMELLADMLGKALDSDKKVTAILFENKEGKAEYTIYLGEAREREFGSGFGARARQQAEAAPTPRRGRTAEPSDQRPTRTTTTSRRTVQPEDPDKLPF